MLARALVSPAQGLHHHEPRYFNFPYFCTMGDLEKLGLVDQNGLERNLSALLLRTLVVDRRQQSDSIEAAIDMEKEGLVDERCLYWSVVPLLAESYNVFAIWIPVGLSSGLSLRCDPLTLVPICDHKRD